MLFLSWDIDPELMRRDTHFNIEAKAGCICRVPSTRRVPTTAAQQDLLKLQQQKIQSDEISQDLLYHICWAGVSMVRLHNEVLT